MNETATNGRSSVPGGAGAALLMERRRQGLSLGDISRQLKLSVRQVEALERDDYSGFTGPVFVHGFIRNYAKLLNLDPQYWSETAAARSRRRRNLPQSSRLRNPRNPLRLRDP